MAGSFDKVFIGLEEVDRIYIGQDLVYESTTPAVITTHPVASGREIGGFGSVPLCIAGACSGGTMKYKAAGSSQPSYGASIPTVASTGTYTLYYYAEGDAEHTDSQEYSISITVSALSNLVGTTWRANTNAEYAWSARATFSVSYVTTLPSGSGISANSFRIPLGINSDVHYHTQHSITSGRYEYRYSIGVIYDRGVSGTIEDKYKDGEFVSYHYEEHNTDFSFYGGSDVTNATLIAWLLANCTRVS